LDTGRNLEEDAAGEVDPEMAMGEIRDAGKVRGLVPVIGADGIGHALLF
jgi:hypothetical protein